MRRKELQKLSMQRLESKYRRSSIQKYYSGQWLPGETRLIDWRKIEGCTWIMHHQGITRYVCKNELKTVIFCLKDGRYPNWRCDTVVTVRHEFRYHQSSGFSSIRGTYLLTIIAYGNTFLRQSNYDWCIHLITFIDLCTDFSTSTMFLYIPTEYIKS